MISVVIPAFNEASVVSQLYERLTRAAESWNEEYEVIVVDDGSTDATVNLITSVHLRDERWKLLCFSRNFGHQSAVSAGIHYSRGDAVIVIDADLQDPPEELERFIAKWREGYQVVYAIRTKRKEGFIKRSCYSLFYHLLKRMAKIEIPLDSGDFCLMDRSVVNVLKAMPERTRFVRGLRCWAGFRQTGLVYERSARAAGEPKYTFSKLIQLAVNGFLSFSDVPLRLASWVGFIFCITSICLIVLLVIWSTANFSLLGMRPRDAAGWTSLVSLIFFMSGLQFLLMGVFGQYLARIFNEVHARPPWIIADAVGIERSVQDSNDLGWFVSRH